DLPGVIVTVANVGTAPFALSICEAAVVGAARNMPAAIGAATTSTEAAMSSSFLCRFSLREVCSDMMRAMRFLRSAPVTLETHGTGEPTQNSQIFKMLSA